MKRILFMLMIGFALFSCSTDEPEPEKPIADTRIKAIETILQISNWDDFNDDIYTMSKFVGGGNSVITTYCSDKVFMDSLILKVDFVNPFDSLDDSWINVNLCNNATSVVPKFKSLDLYRKSIVVNYKEHKDNKFFIRSIDRINKIVTFEYDIKMSSYDFIQGYLKTKYK